MGLSPVTCRENDGAQPWATADPMSCGVCDFLQLLCVAWFRCSTAPAPVDHDKRARHRHQFTGDEAIMSAPEQWQLDGTAPEVYERYCPASEISSHLCATVIR